MSSQPIKHPPITHNGVKYYAKNHSGRRYYRSEDKNGGRFLHRVVWEEANGPIPAGFQIHHINDNPVDNRIDNLTALSRREHFLIHHKDPSESGLKAGRSRSERKAAAARINGAKTRFKKKADIANDNQIELAP